MIDVMPAVWLTLGMGVAFGAGILQNRVAAEGPTHQHRLQREAEWTEIIAEHDDGYGLAIEYVDDGAELCAFKPHDVVYSSVWIGPSELAAVADALSVRACRSERGDSS